MTRHWRDLVAAVRRHPLARYAARSGFVASAAVHLLVSWTAVELARVGYEGRATVATPLRHLAGTPVGGGVLWTIAAGLGALVVWQLTEASVRRGAAARLRPAGRALAYLALAWAAAEVADGAGDDETYEEDLTATLMQSQAGLVVVALLGLAVLAMGGYHAHKGWTSGFVRDLGGTPGPWVVRAGRLGYVAKAVALSIAGGLLTAAAVGYRRDGPQGLDAALGVVLRMPLGRVLLIVIALGFAGYAVYALARARHDWC